MEKLLRKAEMLHCYVKNIFFIFLLLFSSLQQVEAQKRTKESKKMSRQDKKTFLKADKAFDYGDYQGALSMYKSIYAADSNNSELNYKIGICMFEIKKYRRSSLKYFEKTSTSEFPEANYYLGWLYHLQRNYEKSIASYTQYKYFGDSELHSRKEIEDLINKCGTAKLMESKEDRTLQIKNLGDTINTEYPEYAPLIPAQENFMMFTSRRKNLTWTNTDPFGDYFEDIYVSKREDKKWLKPEMLDTIINTTVHDAGTGLSADGEKLLMYRTSKDL